MHSRLIRVLFVVMAIAIGISAGYFLKTIEAKITGNRAAADTLRDQSNALVATLADVRAAQVAYVAQGQGEAFWMDRVAKLLPVLDQQMADFKAAVSAPVAQADLEPAFSAIENFQKLDARAKDYVKSGDAPLASDLIFSDGLEAIGSATTQVKAALADEVRARTAGSAGLQAREMILLGGSAAGVLLLLVILAFTGAAKAAAVEQAQTSDSTHASEPITFTKVIGADPGALAIAAKVCSDMACVVESKQLPALLERTAKVLEASGMIVWVADASGRELRPAMAFGYSDQVMARMGTIPRDAANAAAAAYREGQLRTVNGDGFTNGALVAPLITADGCIGVLSAEMKGGSEKDESSQALASIFAAQLATLVSPPASAALTLAAEG
jgi:hypothetical protein